MLQVQRPPVVRRDVFGGGNDTLSGARTLLMSSRSSSLCDHVVHMLTCMYNQPYVHILKVDNLQGNLITSVSSDSVGSRRAHEPKNTSNAPCITQICLLLTTYPRYTSPNEPLPMHSSLVYCELPLIGLRKVDANVAVIATCIDPATWWGRDCKSCRG